MVTLDVQKTFDSVLLEGFIHKLITTNVPKYLIHILNSYLTNRKFHVKIESASEGPFNIQAGVPQGSVLSPFLYSIFTHDLPASQEILTAMYADDTCFVATANAPQTALSTMENFVNNSIIPYFHSNNQITAPGCSNLCVRKWIASTLTCSIT